jgi:hypothetical protein
VSTRYEGADAKSVSLDWEKPGAEIGQDQLAPGQYALTIGYGEMFYITGTPEELRDLITGLDIEVVAKIEAHAAKPLTLEDFEPDEDGIYCCPRCETGFEPRDYEDLAGLIASVTLHIETDHPVVES